MSAATGELTARDPGSLPGKVLTGVFTTAATCSLVGTGGTGAGLDTGLGSAAAGARTSTANTGVAGTTIVAGGGSGEAATGANGSGEAAVPRIWNAKNHNPPARRAMPAATRGHFRLKLLDRTSVFLSTGSG